MKKKIVSYLLSAVLLVNCFFGGGISLTALASRTEWSAYGEWSAWQDTYVEASDYVKVETRQVQGEQIWEPIIVYKTVYHYYRYAESEYDGSSSPVSGSGLHYYAYDSDFALGEAEVLIDDVVWYEMYDTSGEIWVFMFYVFACDPYTTREVDHEELLLVDDGIKTQYRYCTRTRTDQYDITYNANGGTGAPAAQTKTVVTSVDGSTVYNATLSSTKPSKNYTITYHANGGSVNPASKTVACTFQNWNTSSGGGGTAYAPGATYLPCADVDLYAQWTNPSAGALASPSREGHSFNGWYTAATGGTQITQNTVISADTPLYAHWTADTYTVSYNANGGTGAPGSQTKTYGVDLTLSASVPVRAGYIFKGWGESADGDARYQAGGKYTKNAAATLYAIWQAEKYTVTFHANGGTGAPAPQTFDYNSYITISNTLPVKEYAITFNANGGAVSPQTKTVSCLFTGWNTLQNGTGVSYAAGAPFTADANVTLYAQWQNQPAGTLPTPDRTGYTFAGWYTASANGTAVTADTVIAAAQTVYAHWTAKQYNVQFDPAGGQCGVSSLTVTYGAAYGTLPVPTRTGYRFNGWFTQKSGGTQIKSDATVTVAASQTLYAQWSPETYTLYFDANGGSCDTATKQVVYDAPYGDLPLPVKDGFKFIGWFTAPENGLLVQPADLVKGDIGTLYARWSLLNTYIINYDANGGTGAPPAGVKTETEPYTLSGEVPVKTVTVTFDPAGGVCGSAAAALECAFTAWNTARNGSGTPYLPGGTYELDAAVTLFAQYEGAVLTAVPDAAKTGYTLAGWYADGEKLTADRVFTADQTFSAVWTANEYGVSFRDGDEELGFAAYRYDTPGKLSYGVMPEKEGYSFVGWATEKNGEAVYLYGQQIQNLSAENEYIVPLYAVWHKLLTVDALTYSFGNTHVSFGYSQNYKIPLASYRYIFGKNTRADQLFYNDEVQTDKVWSGNCFGMSATASLFNSPVSGASVTEYNGNAQLVSDLKISDVSAKDGATLLTYLEGMQLSQKCSLIQNDYKKNRDKLNELCAAVEEAKYVDQLPVIALFGVGGGHAVVGYAIKKVTDTQSLLYVYDCNHPETERYITLTTNEAGSYTGWYYKINDRFVWGSAYEGSWISYVPYGHIDHILKSRGNIAQMESLDTNVLAVNSADFVIKNGAGQTVGQCVSGAFTSYDPNVFEMIYTELGGESFTGVEIMLPADRYTFVNLDNAALSLRIANTDLGAQVTTDAREITLDVRDAQNTNTVSLQTQTGDAFQVTLLSSADTGYGEVVLTGVADGSEIVLSEANGRLEVQTANSTQVHLTVDGTQKPLGGQPAEPEQPSVPDQPTDPGQPEQPASNCVCGKYHTGAFAPVLKALHRIIYFFKNLFKR